MYCACIHVCVCIRKSAVDEDRPREQGPGWPVCVRALQLSLMMMREGENEGQVDINPLPLPGRTVAGARVCIHIWRGR